MTINTIALAIDGRHLESTARSQIFPGMLLERHEDGVRPHSVEGGTAPPLIAVENKFAGSDIHTPYEVGDTVYIRYCLPGDIAWLRFSPLMSSDGDLLFLVSYGNGVVKLATGMSYTDQALVGQYLGKFWLDQQRNEFWIKLEF